MNPARTHLGQLVRRLRRDQVSNGLCPDCFTLFTGPDETEVGQQIARHHALTHAHPPCGCPEDPCGGCVL